jgi:hypothetical protein
VVGLLSTAMVKFVYRLFCPQISTDATGNLRDNKGNVKFPPDNRTNWNGDLRYCRDGFPLWPYLRGIATKEMWENDHGIAAIHCVQIRRL